MIYFCFIFFRNRIRHREEEIKISHLLIHFPDAHNNQVRARQVKARSQEPVGQGRFLSVARGPEYVCHHLVPSPGNWRQVLNFTYQVSIPNNILRLGYNLPISNSSFANHISCCFSSYQNLFICQ